MTRVINFLTIHPELIASNLEVGPFLWAKKAGLCEFQVINLRDFAVDQRGSVDDRPYGGGDGMLMRLEPIVNALRSIDHGKIFIPSPAGPLWSEDACHKQAASDEIITFICPRFAGVDERLRLVFPINEYSIGNFVVSGGELPSLVIADSILRKIEGVLGNALSAGIESFSPKLSGRLEHAQYTRPEDFEGHKVPPILLSGDHAAIAKWQNEQQIERTRRLKPQLNK